VPIANAYESDFEIVIHVQPIVDIWRQKLLGLESTIKGKYQGNLVNAQPLFSRAVQSGRVKELDYEARKQSILQVVPKLREEERLFVNIAAQSLESSEDWFEEDVPYHKIVLEITEQKPIKATSGLIRKIDNLRAKGMKIAIDDYGVGFNNMLLISRLKPDFIKVNRTIVVEGDIPTLEGIISYCRKANTLLIAEGVETLQQREMLINLGVRYMQGFLFGYPVPSDDYTAGTVTL
jgi:EAL domain-containing protein (putative c-di-GMP-specific phosphodiesterase class I)